MSSREMSDTIALIGRETSVVRAWIYAISQISQFGCRKFAQSNSTAASDVGLNQFGLSQVTDENDFDCWQVASVRQRFSDECRIQFHLRMMGMDNLSQLGSLAIDDTRDNERWEAVAEKAWTSWGKQGAIGVVRGPIKSGKSNICLLISQYFLQRGCTVVSNILVFDPPSAYIYSAKLSDLLIAVCEAQLKGKEVLLVLDEAGLFWNKIETVQKRNVNLSKILLCTGKMNSSLLFCSHFEEALPGIIARNYVASFDKRGLREAFVEITDGIKIRPRLLTHIPGTELKYDPTQLQYFSVDLSVEDLFDFMSSLPHSLSPDSSQWQLLSDYIFKHQGETGEESLNPKDVALYLRKRGQSERQIATVVGKSCSTVHSWVSEQKA